MIICKIYIHPAIPFILLVWMLFFRIVAWQGIPWTDIIHCGIIHPDIDHCTITCPIIIHLTVSWFTIVQLSASSQGAYRFAALGDTNILDTLGQIL